MMRTRYLPLGIALTALFFSGCASLNPKPFSDFSTSVKSAQDGMSQAVQVAQSAARETLVENMASDPNAKFADLQILAEGGYKWKYAAKTPPVYLALANASGKLAQLNDVFAGYAGLLSDLAGNAVVDPTAFDQMATDLNKNANQLTADTGAPNANNAIGIFSVAATAAFEQFINSKRKDDLRSALVNNQDTVAAYSKYCLTLIHTLRGIVQSHYNQSFLSLLKQWASTKTGATKNVSDRRGSITANALKLNDAHVASLQMLEEVENALSAIPGAHAELVKSLDAPTGLLANAKQLTASGEHLHQLYQQLQSSQGAGQ